MLPKFPMMKSLGYYLSPRGLLRALKAPTIRARIARKLNQEVSGYLGASAGRLSVAEISSATY